MVSRASVSRPRLPTTPGLRPGPGARGNRPARFPYAASSCRWPLGARPHHRWILGVRLPIASAHASSTPLPGHRDKTRPNTNRGDHQDQNGVPPPEVCKPPPAPACLTVRSMTEFTRRSARVLLLDASDRLLLVQSGDAWLVPGGGGVEGEGLAEAAARELAATRENHLPGQPGCPGRRLDR
jgi:hypothetical protein